MGLGKTMTALALILANPYVKKAPKMDRKAAISQLNGNFDKTWYHLINRNRVVVCQKQKDITNNKLPNSIFNDFFILV